VKRHPKLQQLSRDHHQALVLAKACQRAASSEDCTTLNLTYTRLAYAMTHELDPHFKNEEMNFLPRLANGVHDSLIRHTLKDHEQLRALALAAQQGNQQAMQTFGDLLAEHVRFEERELFPAIEQSM
jgi:iron-sulfur cluster repair protein YtfE (RIC family)